MVLINVLKDRYGMSDTDTQALIDLRKHSEWAFSTIANEREEYNDLQAEYSEEYTKYYFALYKIALLSVLDAPTTEDISTEGVDVLEAMVAQRFQEDPEFEIGESWASLELGDWFDRRIKNIRKGKFLTPDYRVKIAKDEYAARWDPQDHPSLDALLKDGKAYKEAIKSPKTATRQIPAKNPRSRSNSPPPAPKKAKVKPVMIGGIAYDLANKEFNPRGFKKYEHLTAGFFNTHYTYDIQPVSKEPETKCCARLVLDGAGTPYPKIRMPFWRRKADVGVKPCDDCFTFRFPTDLMAPTFLQDFITQIKLEKQKGEAVFWDEQGFVNSFVSPNLTYWEQNHPDWATKLGIEVSMVRTTKMIVSECD